MVFPYDYFAPQPETSGAWAWAYGCLFAMTTSGFSDEVVWAVLARCYGLEKPEIQDVMVAEIIDTVRVVGVSAEEVKKRPYRQHRVGERELMIGLRKRVLLQYLGGWQWP